MHRPVLSLFSSILNGINHCNAQIWCRIRDMSTVSLVGRSINWVSDERFRFFHAPLKSINFNEMKISEIPSCWWCYGIFMIHTLSSCTHLPLLPLYLHYIQFDEQIIIIVMIRALNLAFMLNIFALSKQKWIILNDASFMLYIYLGNY